MNARQRVLEAYGNRCAWCGAQQFLELDHTFGGGNVHRRRLGHTKLHTWLDREHTRTGKWPEGYQLLCTTPDNRGCHDTKSGRTPRQKGPPPMPARKGATNHNISLSDDLTTQLTARAEEPAYGGSKSAYVQAALTAFMGGQLDQTTMAQIGTRLDALQGALLRALSDHLDRPEAPQLPARLQSIDERLLRLEKYVEELTTSMYRLTQQHDSAAPKRGIAKWIQR